MKLICAPGPDVFGLDREDCIRQLEMLIHAYDPCIGCSTHLLKVEFV